MAVLVKPNGLFGTAYMATIKPLRYLIVYPALIRGIQRRWQAEQSGRPHEAASSHTAHAQPQGRADDNRGRGDEQVV